ncbi:hypothetical protein PN36_12290 [Candidatus Thiomargarita nelsonii]|uniref:CHAT domain-containing protein n=1 Tax=Candidatus Thiomargarita nelsonii TaxID=1003181 RepID=A0A4E0QQB9_9GAMM|nr:hypothetical protein PN36_12290 [Candidatus Thiomargarita nelsonii]
MGLPYALYVAGNKNTILTLWSISDEVTVEFIRRFFIKLKAGVGQVNAIKLRINARNRGIRSPRFILGEPTPKLKFGLLKTLT